MTSSPLAHRIAGEIKGAISAGHIAPGMHLSVQRFAEEFYVSRSPVRQAMELLAGSGVLEHRRNRGFFVRQAPAVEAGSPQANRPFEEPNEYQRLAEVMQEPWEELNKLN